MLRKKKTEFPMFAVILLIFGLAWALEELGFLKASIPWFPIILIVIAVSMIVNRYNK